MTQQAPFSIYNASAGSGKTYALVKQYLKILFSAENDDAYRSILAITFTNKAVHEMKSRILQSLIEFSKDVPNTKAQGLMDDLAQSEETGLSVEKLRDKSKKILKHIIHNYAGFDISTIDKFTHRVIRAFAHDLNLPLSFEVTLESDALLQEAVDAVVAKAGTDELLTKMLVDYTMEKTDDDKSWDISREIFEAGRMLNKENDVAPLEEFKKQDLEFFIKLKKDLAKACEDLGGNCKDSATKILQDIDDNGVDRKSFSGGYFIKHLEGISNGIYNPKLKTYHSHEDIKTNKGVRDEDLIESMRPDFVAKMALIYADFSKRDFYNAFLKNLTPLSLFSEIGKSMSEIQSDRNMLSIAEFNALIHAEIQNQPAPFIYERLGERYRHFFIDEFQDTSEMQWKNLVPLIHNALSGESMDNKRGTLMIVGDPKQSIYRWRGGKAEQFVELAKGNHPFFNIDHQLEPLTKNWRSCNKIIEFNNDFFNFVANDFENVDYQTLYKGCTQEFGKNDGGLVQIDLLPAKIEMEEDENRSELYCQRTLEKILEVKSQGYRWEDIVVLTRKRSHGVMIADYLTANGVDILSSETLLIANSSKVIFAVNTLRFLKNPNDAMAKAKMLTFVAADILKQTSIHEFIAEGMKLFAENFKDYLRKHNLEFSVEKLRTLALYEACNYIFTSFGIAQNDGYVQYFLDLALEKEARNQFGVADFLDFWDANAEKLSIPSPEGKPAVKLMTIHKAKGLEFPIVIFPFAEEEYGRSPKDKLWLDADSDEFGVSKMLVSNSSAVESMGENAKSTHKLKQEEILFDNINILYVAFTRASEQLHIISALNISKKGELAANNMSTIIINFLKNKNVFEEDKLEYQFGIANTCPNIDLEETATENINSDFEKMPRSNIKIAEREAMMWDSKQASAIEFGNVLHEILSSIERRSDVIIAVDEALSIGLINLSQREDVETALYNVIDHPEISDFFSQGKVLNEQPILNISGNILIPDRVVLVDNRAFLLDYKTGKPLPKHKIQVENYKSAIESMGISVSKMRLVYIGEDVNVINL